MCAEQLFPDELLLFPVGFMGKDVDFVFGDRGEDRIAGERDLFLNPGREEHGIIVAQ